MCVCVEIIFCVNFSHINSCYFSRHDNYTVIDGLSLDMAPAVGSLSVVMVTISKNDLAEGVIQFGTPPPQGFLGTVSMYVLLRVYVFMSLCVFVYNKQLEN